MNSKDGNDIVWGVVNQKSLGGRLHGDDAFSFSLLVPAAVSCEVSAVPAAD